MVPLSARTMKALRACLRAARRLRAATGHEPTPLEIGEALHRPVAQVIRLLQLNQASVSLDSLGAVEDDASVADSLVKADENADLIDALTEKVLEYRLDGWLGRLPARKREVICQRYGLDRREPQKLKAIGARLGVTDSRVRQTQVEALAALRSMTQDKGVYVGGSGSLIARCRRYKEGRTSWMFSGAS